MFRSVLVPSIKGSIRLFSTASSEAASRLIQHGLQGMKSLNNPFNVEKTTLDDTEYILALLQNGNMRLQSPRNHYNDYHYNSEDDAFENIEDGHNIIEAFTRDLMCDFNGCPDF